MLIKNGEWFYQSYVEGAGGNHHHLLGGPEASPGKFWNWDSKKWFKSAFQAVYFKLS